MHIAHAFNVCSVATVCNVLSKNFIFSSINIVDNKIYTIVNEYKTISFEFQNVLPNRLISYRTDFSIFLLY